MAVLKRDEFLNKLKEIIGDSTEDKDMALLEDMTDTYNDLESRASSETNWEQKYKENDAEWRKKYRDRFFSAPAKDEPDIDDPDEKPKALSYNDLFKEEK